GDSWRLRRRSWRNACVTGAAEDPGRTFRPHDRPARAIALLRPGHRRPPPGPRGRRHPGPGRESRHTAGAPRSAVPARPSSSDGGRWPVAARRLQSSDRLARMTAETDNAALQTQVSRSSFYAAMRIMPRAEREAMFAIYRFCRLVDDIADDGTRARPQRAAELEGWRADLAALYDGRPAGRAAFLAQSVHAFGLRPAAFLAGVGGMGIGVVSGMHAPG